MTTIFLHDYLQQINELLDNDRVREAAAHCRHILQQYPRHLGTYRALAQALLEQGEHADAIDLFHRVLSAEPSDFISHLGLAIIYQEQSELTSAIWHMERAYEMKPYDAVVQEKLKQLYRQNAIPSPGRLTLTKGALARLYLRGDLYQQAATEFRQLLSQEENRVDIELLLAETLWRDGQRVEAVEICRKVLKKLPNCIDAQAILADVWFATGRTAEAEEYVQRLQELTLIDANHKESETPLAHALRANGQVKLPEAIEVATLEDLPAPEVEEEIQADWVDQAAFGDELVFSDESVAEEGEQESEGLFGWLRDDTLPEDDLFGEKGTDGDEFGMPVSADSIPVAESLWLVDEESSIDDELDRTDDVADWLMGLDDSADFQDGGQLDIFPDLQEEASQKIDISPWETADSTADPDQDLDDWLKSDQPEPRDASDSPEMMESEWFGASSFHDRVKTGDETTLLNEDSEWLSMLDDMESQAQHLDEKPEMPEDDAVPDDDQADDIPEWSGEADEVEPSPEEESEPLSEWLNAQIPAAEEQDSPSEDDPMDDLPDWMHTGMFDSEDGDAAADAESEAVKPHVFSTSEDAPMPDWLQSNDSLPDEDTDVADLMADEQELTLESSLEENIPDWMLDEMAEDEVPSGFSALLGGKATDQLVKPFGFDPPVDEADVQESEVPDWLLGADSEIEDDDEPDLSPQEEDAGVSLRGTQQDDHEAPVWLADEQGQDEMLDGSSEDRWDGELSSPEAEPLDQIPDWLVGDDSEDESEPQLAEQRLENMEMHLSEPSDEGGSDTSSAGEEIGLADDAELLLEWADEDDLEDSVEDAEQQEDDMSEWLFSDDLDSQPEESQEPGEPLDQIDPLSGELPVEADLDWLVADDTQPDEDQESLSEAESDNELGPVTDEIPEWLKTGQFDLASEGDRSLELPEFNAEIVSEEESGVGALDVDLQPESLVSDEDAGFEALEPDSDDLLDWMSGDDFDKLGSAEDAELVGGEQVELTTDADAQTTMNDDLPDWLSSGAFEVDDDAETARGEEDAAALDLSQELGLSIADESDDLMNGEVLPAETVDDMLSSSSEREGSAAIVWPSVGEVDDQEADESDLGIDDEKLSAPLEPTSDDSLTGFEDFDGIEDALDASDDESAAVDSSWRDLVDDVTDELPEDLDDAMAWIEELAANKEAPVEELPTIAKAIESEEEAIVQAEPEIEPQQLVETATDAEEDSFADSFEDSEFEFASDGIDIDGMLEQMPTTDSEFDLEMDFEAILDAQGAEDDDDFLSELSQMSLDSDIDLSWPDTDDLSEQPELTLESASAGEEQITEEPVDEEIDTVVAPDAVEWLDQPADEEIVPVHEQPTLAAAPPAERMEAAVEAQSVDSLSESDDSGEIELPVELDETEEEFEEAIAWLDEMSEGTAPEDEAAGDGGEEDALEAALAEMFTNPTQERVEAAELQEALDWLTQLAEQEGTPIAESLVEEAGSLEIAEDELQEALDWLEKLAWEQEPADADMETLPDLGLSGNRGKPGAVDNLADLLDETDDAEEDMLWIDKQPSSSGLSFSDIDESDGTSELIEALESVEPAAAETSAADGDEAFDFDAELMAGLPTDADSSFGWADDAVDLADSQADLLDLETDELALPVDEPSEQADAPAELKIRPTFGADDDAMFELSVGVSEGVLEGGFLDDLPEDADAALAWLEQFVETDEGEDQLVSADAQVSDDQLMDMSDAFVEEPLELKLPSDAPTLDIKPTFGGDDDAMFELSVGVSEGVLEEGFLDDLPDDADAALEWLEQFVEPDADDEAESLDSAASVVADQPEADDAGTEEGYQGDSVETAEPPDAPTLDIKPTFGADDDAMFELSVGMSEGVLEEGFLDDMPEDADAALAWLESFVDDDQPEEVKGVADSPQVDSRRSKVADLAREILGEMGEELDADLLENIPDDPDEAVAWLQQFVVDEPDADEDSESEIPDFESESSLDGSFLDNMPEDPDDAMSWLESIADDDDLLSMDSEDDLPDVTELTLDSGIDVETLLSGDDDQAGLDDLSDLSDLLADNAAAAEQAEDEHEINLDSGVSDSLPDWLTFEPGQEGASDKTEEWLQSLPEPDVAGWLEGEEAATVSGVYDFNASLTQEEVRFGTGPLPSLEPLPEPAAPRQAAAEKSQSLEAGTALKDQETLALARQALADGQFKEAAAHFGTMVESENELELVIDELKKVVAEYGGQSPLYRVLGDAYMGNGQLQEALDAYRLTLDQM